MTSIAKRLEGSPGTAIATGSVAITRSREGAGCCRLLGQRAYWIISWGLGSSWHDQPIRSCR